MKSVVKESIVVNMTNLKFFERKDMRAKKKDREGERRCLTLKKMKKKIYSFPDSDIANMLEHSLKKQRI